jgi:hypothetical protein
VTDEEVEEKEEDKSPPPRRNWQMGMFDEGRDFF